MSIVFKIQGLSNYISTIAYQIFVINMYNFFWPNNDEDILLIYFKKKKS